MPPHRNRPSTDPTKRPSRRGPISLEVSELRNVFIQLELVDPEKWTPVIDKLVADKFKHVIDIGAQMGSETNRVRALEDQLRARDLRISSLELELKHANKLANNATRARIAAERALAEAKRDQRR